MLDFNSTLYLTSMLVLSFNAFLHFSASSWSQCFFSLQCLTSVSRFPSLRRRGHIECDHVLLNLSPSISLQCFILVSTLSFTSKLYLCFQRFPSLQCLTSVTCFPSLRRSGHIECDEGFLNLSPSISLQCFIWVSRLSFTSKLYLGFNPFLHFNALLHFNA